MTEHEKIVRYWHTIELLQPQSAPKLKKREKLYDAFIHDMRIGYPVLPWATGSIVSKQHLPKRRVWSHTLFAHIYDSRRVAEQLNKIYGADQGYREPQFRESALFAAKFNMAGHFVDESFVLSSESWFLGRVLTRKDWTRGFEDDQRVAGEKARELFDGQVSGEALHELTRWILQYLGLAGFFGEMNDKVFRFRSQPVNPSKPESEDDPLNSFLLDDLAAVADSLGTNVQSAPLDQYLSKHDTLQRLHIDDDNVSLSLIDHLMPDAYAMGCWPSARHIGLVHSQQLAVNTILTTIGKSQGLIGVNGPPGTGKTTLLRDLIAAIVTSRADVLSKFRRASDGFIVNGLEAANDNGKQQVCFKLNPDLYGFEIVVASSNNGAVENVTLELPQRDKIDESWLPEAEYFSELGELVSGKPAWGLISGALGSNRRRTKFVQRYFFGQSPSSNDDEVDLEAEDEADSDDEFGDIVNSLFSASGTTENNPVAHEDLTERAVGKEEEQKGFFGFLNASAEVNKDRSPEQRQAIWKQAIADYEAAKTEVHKTSEAASQIRQLLQALSKTRKMIVEQTTALGVLKTKLADASAQLSRLDSEESRPANLALKQSLDALEAHQARKPGFWAKVFSFWALQRDWDAKRERLEDLQNIAKSEFNRIARLIKQLEVSRDSLEEQTADTEYKLQRLNIQRQALTKDAIDVAGYCKAEHLLAWLHEGVIGRGEAIELAEPWRIEGWRQARARVFIKALKLHRTFFELEAFRIRSNLFLVNGMLAGTRYQNISHEAVRSAWASLFMVVPVLSTTFASFARSFGSLGVNEIGWLLVDEAGQAPPQAAVGALWRSRRALLVGDPLQLKPIVTVSDAVLEHMRTRYQVDTHWLPNRQSAQTLADEATRWGRMAGPAENKSWVGLPLIVHRRCDKPMYTLANRIAYDGAMVFGTLAPPPDRETPASLQSGWIQASGKSQGNWVPDEGKALQTLLALLHEDGVEATDISVITPFRAVQQNLKRILRDKVVSGTIHTMQGKEASVVILVLGGNTEGSGARDWAVSEPNLLNVAATRAKRRFYVIGDRNDWKNRALFCDVMDLLPLLTLPERKLDNLDYKVV